MPIITLKDVKTLLNYTDDTYDVRIKALIPYVQDKVVAITNNHFANDSIESYGEDYVFASADNPTITATDPGFTEEGFKNGDDIWIHGSVRNDGVYQISTAASTVLTLTVDASGVVQDEDVEDEDVSGVYITYVRFPRGIKPAVANMIRYDLLERAERTGVSSESVGNYSVSYFRAAGLGLDYPDDVVGGLDPWVIPAVG